VTSKLAEMSVAKCRPSVPYDANLLLLMFPVMIRLVFMNEHITTVKSADNKIVWLCMYMCLKKLRTL